MINNVTTMMKINTSHASVKNYVRRVETYAAIDFGLGC